MNKPFDFVAELAELSAGNFHKQEQIAELKRLWAAATPGEWAVSKLAYKGDSHKYLEIESIGNAYWIAKVLWFDPSPVNGEDPKYRANADLIAATHNAFPALIAALEAAEAERDAVRKENDFMRLRLAESDKACVYCSLPKAEMVACANGFPGCARADDLFHCDELTRRDERNKSIGAAEVWDQISEYEGNKDFPAIIRRFDALNKAAELRKKGGA